MTVTGKRAVQAVRHVLQEAGLGRTSRLNGGTVTGWIPRNLCGSTGFSVKPTSNQGEVVWHIVLSGRPHLSYRTWTERNGDDDTIELSEPRNPEGLFPRIKAAFESIGLEVRNLHFGGAQLHWDDDVSYEVVTNHPEWLESHNPRNHHPDTEAPLLTAFRFKGSYSSYMGPFSPVSEPLAGYIIDGAPYLTRESVEHLANVHAQLLAQHDEHLSKAIETNRDVDAHNERIRNSNAPTGGQVQPSEHVRYRVREPRWDYGELDFTDDGRLRMAPKGRSEHAANPVEITNHWGDRVQVWPLPGHWMERLDTFEPTVPFLLDGEMRDRVPFPTIDAQHGSEAPWIREEPQTGPRM